jgi:transposase-like protein
MNKKYENLHIRELLPSIQGWCREGSTYDEIAEMLTVGTKTIYKWRKKYPEFAAAIREGRAISSGVLLNAAYKQAVGYTLPVTEAQKVKKQRWDPESQKMLTDEVLETVTYNKTVDPSERMTKFMLMNRFPEKFRERQAPETDGSVRVVFRGMSDDEIMETLG